MISMAVTTTVFKLLPGKTREYLDLACDIMEGRRGEYELSRHRLGLTVERSWIEPTNAGDFLITYYEGDDPVRSLRGMAGSAEPFDVWFRERFRDLTGVDLGKPDSLAPGELIFESPKLAVEGVLKPLATVFPVKPGMKNDWREWLDELLVSRAEEYRAYMWRYGFAVEKAFLLHTSEGPLAVLYFEGSDPALSIARFARSHNPFDAWMREEMLYLNGIDFIRRSTAPAPDLVLDWAETRKIAA